ncbi:MAG: AraC family transcriptional regulator [Arachidicoccus sp.]|nr:AraC family transcriptional regulator [Arachidicoccus sp.]
MKIEYEIVTPDKDSSFHIIFHKKINSKDFEWQYHYHPEYELVYIKEGSGARHVGNHIGRYRHGDLILIGSNLPHSGFGLHATDPHEEIVLQVNSSVLPLHLTEMEPVAELFDRSKYGISFSKKIHKIIGDALYAMIDESPAQRYLSMLKIFQNLAHAEEYYLLNKNIVNSESIKKHKARLQKVFTYVEKYFNEEIEIENVAQIAGLSVPAFCNFFKKTTQITFTAFVNHYRVQQACKLLLEDKTIAEVSYNCGFNNVTYFNKIFKNVMNKTPTEYLKEINAA